MPVRTTGVRCAVSILASALVLSGCFAGTAGDGGGDRISVGLAFQPVAEM